VAEEFHVAVGGVAGWEFDGFDGARWEVDVVESVEGRDVAGCDVFLPGD